MQVGIIKLPSVVILHDLLHGGDGVGEEIEAVVETLPHIGIPLLIHQQLFDETARVGHVVPNQPDGDHA